MAGAPLLSARQAPTPFNELIPNKKIGRKFLDALEHARARRRTACEAGAKPEPPLMNRRIVWLAQRGVELAVNASEEKEKEMNSNVTEVAPDVFRISTFNPTYGIQFNQFLIRDDEPFLMHTGFKNMFSNTLEGVSTIIDPSKLRWIGFSHFESDECGALNEWLGIAPHAQAVCSFVGAFVNVNDFADRPARGLDDGEAFEIGRHRLRFLATPHVPHCWDAGLFFEENDRTLLCSDLFFHPGDPEPLIESGVVERARDSIIAGLSGPLAKDMPYTPYTDGALRRLAALAPQTLALMHGSSFRGDGHAAIISLAEIIKETIGRPEGTQD